jgi:uncharacterized membrane protein YfcA
MPVMLGVLAGSWVGSRRLADANPKALRILFAVVVAAMALQMIYGGLRGQI